MAGVAWPVARSRRLCITHGRECPWSRGEDPTEAVQRACADLARSLGLRVDLATPNPGNFLHCNPATADHRKRGLGIFAHAGEAEAELRDLIERAMTHMPEDPAEAARQAWRDAHNPFRGVRHTVETVGWLFEASSHWHREVVKDSTSDAERDIRHGLWLDENRERTD